MNLPKVTATKTRMIETYFFESLWFLTSCSSEQLNYSFDEPAQKFLPISRNCCAQIPKLNIYLEISRENLFSENLFLDTYNAALTNLPKIFGQDCKLLLRKLQKIQIFFFSNYMFSLKMFFETRRMQLRQPCRNFPSVSEVFYGKISLIDKSVKFSQNIFRTKCSPGDLCRLMEHAGEKFRQKCGKFSFKVQQKSTKLYSFKSIAFPREVRPNT